MLNSRSTSIEFKNNKSRPIRFTLINGALSIILIFSLLFSALFSSAVSASGSDSSGNTSDGTSSAGLTAAAASGTQTPILDPNDPDAPAIDGTAYVLYDVQSGTFLLGNNQDTPLAPASITKVMTVLLAFENLKLTDTITVTRDMYESIPADYVRLGLVEGEEITVEQALYACLLISANDAAMKLALNIPLIDIRIYAQIRKKLLDAMGGRVHEIIVGGAPMNQEVTDFLYKIKFPFTIGYGMTECGPLICYDHNNEYIPGSCGQVLKGIMEARIDSEDPYNTVGEIQIRGENVMKGYYKNEEATAKAFTDDGWFLTGDLGTIDHNNRIYLRGRCKTMILSSNGQNIYPEEIESKLNNLPCVMESIIIEKNDKLIGLVYPDYDMVDSTGISHEDLPVIMEQNRLELNKLIAPYEAVSKIQLYPTEFEKTPKKSIKRYLYSNY